MTPTPHDVAPKVTRQHDVMDMVLLGAPRATREAFKESAHFKEQVVTLVTGMLHAVDSLAVVALEDEERRRAMIHSLMTSPPVPIRLQDLEAPTVRVLHRDPEVHPVDEDGGDGL